MSFFGMISGTVAARRVAQPAAQLWQETVNYIIIKGHGLTWEDSGYLLTLSYLISVLRFRCTHMSISSDKMGAVIVMTADLLGQTLKEVWGRQLPPHQISGLIKEWVDSMPSEFHVWQDRVNHACQKSGQWPPASLDIISEKGVTLYIEDIKNWYRDSAGDDLSSSDVAELHRTITRHLTQM